MKLWRSGPADSEVSVVTVDGVDYDASAIAPEFGPDFFAAGGLAALSAAVASGELPRADIDGSARIGAPLGRPQALICIGQNYAAHAAESGAAPPERPIIFFKHPNTIAGPYDTALIPRASEKTDWEVELGVVIGTPVSYLESREEAARAIAGYVVANDLSERDFQIAQSGGQWSKGKVSPGFSPLGPWFVTADEIDAGALRIRSWVNGEPRQDSNTADMIFDPATIVHHLSQYMRLEAGDIILTGTPEGVALSGRFDYLRAGDVVELEIEGLGRQRQEFAQA